MPSPAQFSTCTFLDPLGTLSVFKGHINGVPVYGPFGNCDYIVELGTFVVPLPSNDDRKPEDPCSADCLKSLRGWKNPAQSQAQKTEGK